MDNVLRHNDFDSRLETFPPSDRTVLGSHFDAAPTRKVVVCGEGGCPDLGARRARRLSAKIIVPFLLAWNIVEGVEMSMQFSNAYFGTFEPFGVDHSQHLVPVLMFPFLAVADDAALSHRADRLADAEKSVCRCMEALTTVPSEDELSTVDFDVLLPKAVICPHRPALEFGKDALQRVEPRLVSDDIENEPVVISR